MIPSKIDFPVFEANQVLTNEHLNCMHSYLDEQIRLTRATLHGIGIVCGLTVSVSGNSITISKGYGVTSEGYVANLGNEDFVADRYKAYAVPSEDGYSLLPGVASKTPPSSKLLVKGQVKDLDIAGFLKTQPLLELLDKNHRDYANGRALSSEVFKNKVVLLFVELFEEDLKNCSPSSCDDKGKKITVTLRKLLIDASLLEAVNKKINDNIKTKATGDFFPDLTARLNLPDLRLPRLKLLVNSKINAQAIFSAYQNVLTKGFFDAVGQALDEAYLAFQPLLTALGDHKLSEKLETIFDRYKSAENNQDIIYTQYFYDVLDDLIQSYEEFRWKALDLMSLCNPPEELFPRHLELGEAMGGNFAGYKEHRHYFRPSPAIAEQRLLYGEVQQLFLRLKLMLELFEVPNNSLDTKPGSVVKITPSRLGGVELSEKAIPFYYHKTNKNTLPLLNAWNFHKTRTGRAGQNLGYYIGSQFHHDPGKSVRPLNFDLEHFNFFRIEGHIGLPWRDVLTDLLNKINLNRLPFDVVALNAHPQAVSSDPLVSSCITNDLQVIYDAWAKEWECFLKDNINFLSHLQIPVKTAAIVEKTVTTAPTGLVFPPRVKIDVLSGLSNLKGSLGQMIATEIEKNSAKHTSFTKLFDSVVASLYEDPEIKTLPLSDVKLGINNPIEVISALFDFSNALTFNVNELRYTSISSKYQTALKAINEYAKDILLYTPTHINPILTQEIKEQLLKALDELLKTSLIERLEELGAEQERRKKQIEELLFFSHFIQKHPGLEHKAGVPKGGTFVLIFQETPKGVISAGQISFSTHNLSGEAKVSAASKAGSASITKPSTLNLTADQKKLLIDTLKSQGIMIPDAALSVLASSPATAVDVTKIINIPRLPEKVVIADFYLPYRCCSSCPPVQFILPKAPPTFDVEIGCTDKGNARVTITPKGGLPPYDLKVDGVDYKALPETLSLRAGNHTLEIRDAEGTESVQKAITIASAITFGTPKYECSKDRRTYVASFAVNGGTPPYKFNNTEVPGNRYTSDPIKSGETKTFLFVDNNGCTAKIDVRKVCSMIKDDTIDLDKPQ